MIGKGDKERRVSLDPDVAGLIQSYLLAERPETASRALFIVAKGRTGGSWERYLDGVSAQVRRPMTVYLERLQGTHARSSVQGAASELAH